MCCLMALRQDGVSFNAFFQHRLCEVEGHLQRLKELVPEVHPVKWVESGDNPADLVTKAGTRPEALQPGGKWQAGPAWLRLPRVEWPASLPADDGSIPEREIRKGAVLNSLVTPSNLQSVCQELLVRKTKLGVVCGALARIVRGACSQEREQCLVHPSMRDRAAAEKLLLMMEQVEVRVAWEKGKLDALNVQEENGLLVTRGRYRRGRLLQVTGRESLPILLATSRLAVLYCLEAHEADHLRDPASILAKTRRRVWLVGGRALARRVARSCLPCRRILRKGSEQLMGQVPAAVADPCPPFQNVALDLFGPLVARGIGGHARKNFKTWAVLFVCMGTRAVAIWLAASYSCQDFLLCLQRQAAVYGLPQAVHSDKGSQLTAAAADLKEWDSFAEEALKQGVVWSFSPTACPWRNGQAERAVGLAKSTLKRQVDAYELLNFAELETALLQVAAVMNRRPLTARIYDDDTFFPVAPADLLHGRAESYCGTAVEEGNLVVRLQKVSRFVELWWERWQSAAFLLFTPRGKWALSRRALQVGDVVMLLGERKLGPGTYRLAMVSQVHPDEAGVVRTVSIRMRSRRRRGDRGGLEECVMACQRLAVIVPREERRQAGILEDD